MQNRSRRNFIYKAALATTAPFLFKPSVSFAAHKNSNKSENGRVILFQGDSITDGNRGRNNDPNHIMGHGYAFSIASRIGADFPEKQYQFYNRGISGNKITDLADRWQTDTLDLLPDVLSILVGVNDASSVVFNWEPVVSVKEYKQTYNVLLEQTLEKFPNLLLVLGEPFILPVGKVKENWEVYHADIQERQEIVKQLAQKYNAVWVGFQGVFKNAQKKAPADYWIWDGVHPTVAGHELMAREWIKKVEERSSF